jgi:NAD(P)H-dependent FMN reductase
MVKLAVVIASTRPGRAGLPIGTWFVERARKDGRFDVEIADLKELDLPLLDEPKHPRFAQYEHAHTKAWSAFVKRMDAYVFVTPEYNYGPAPALVNALDYLYAEWHYKPAGFVSYGGVSGGMRSVQMTKQVVSALKMVALAEGVAITSYVNHMKEDVFVPTEAHDKAAKTVLDELQRWSGALKALRA